MKTNLVTFLLMDLYIQSIQTCLDSKLFTFFYLANFLIYLLLWYHLESSLKNRRKLTRWRIIDNHKSAYAPSKNVSLQYILKGIFVEARCVVSVTMKKSVCHLLRKFCQNKVMVSYLCMICPLKYTIHMCTLM